MKRNKKLNVLYSIEQPKKKKKKQQKTQFINFILSISGTFLGR